MQHSQHFQNVHGAPSDGVRHVGDLGNILTPGNGPTVVTILDDVISLAPEDDTSILGKAIVVHAGEDDLGTAGDSGSLATGNAGGRVACGIICAV